METTTASPRGSQSVNIKGNGGLRWRYGHTVYIRYSVRGDQKEEPAARLEMDPATLTPEQLQAERKKAEAVAMKKLRARLRQVHRDEFVGLKEERATVKELVDEYVMHLEMKAAKSVRTVKAQLAHVTESLGLTRAVDLTTAKLEKYILDRRADGLSAKTVENEVQLLKAALNRARKSGRLIRTPYVELPKVNNARQGFFEASEFESVAQNIVDPVVKDIVLFGYLTGWRKGEIVGHRESIPRGEAPRPRKWITEPLRWDAVDRTAKEVRLRTSKNGRPRLLPLTGELWDLFERRWKAREYQTPEGVTGLSAYVFHRGGQPVRDFYKAFKAACMAAKVPDKMFHDFRRTAARDMVRAGTPETVAMQITGHVTRSMFDRYNVTSTEDMQKALRRTQDHRAAMPKAPNVVTFPDASEGNKQGSR